MPKLFWPTFHLYPAYMSIVALAFFFIHKVLVHTLVYVYVHMHLLLSMLVSVHSSMHMSLDMAMHVPVRMWMHPQVLGATAEQLSAADDDDSPKDVLIELVSSLCAALDGMKVGALKNKLRSLGVDDDTISELDDDDDGPTAAAIKQHISYCLYSCGLYSYGSILVMAAYKLWQVPRPQQPSCILVIAHIVVAYIVMAAYYGSI